MSGPLAIDLYCGLGGWADGALLEGYDVIGFDIERHVYGDHRYPAQLVIQDVRTLHGSQFKSAALLVASPPCTEFSWMAMPWSRAKQVARALRGEDEFPANYKGSRTAEQLTELFRACFRIQREACEAAGHHIPLIVENVKGAQPWVGRARGSFGSFYLWGDVPALMPTPTRARKFNPDRVDHSTKNSGGSWFRVSHNNVPHSRGDVVKHTPHMTNSGEHVKVGGLNWSKYRQPDYKTSGAAGCFRDTPAQRYRAALADGSKGGGDWFGSGDNCSPQRRHGSKSNSRKAASAMIAKIPLTLSRHIAAVYAS